MKGLCKTISIVVVLVTLVFVIVSNSDAKEKIVLKLGHIWGPNHLIHKECVFFADLVKKESKGEVEIQIFPAEQLVKAKELPYAVSKGMIDMGTIVGAYISGKVPELDVYFLPGLRTWDSLLKGYRGGMAEITNKVLGERLNLKLLFYFFGGSNELWTVKKPVRAVDDMNGLLIRGGGGALNEIVRALGATPVTVSGAEVYQGLQRGTFDGCYWGSTSYLAQKAWEVCKYGTRLSQPFGLMTPNVSINLDRWNKLPPEVQKILADCSTKADENGIVVGKEELNTLWTEAKKGGLTIVDMNPKDEQQWMKRIEKVWDWYAEQSGEVGRQLLEIAKKFR